MAARKKLYSCYHQAQLCQDVKFMVGGALETEEFGQQIGSDSYSPDLCLAVTNATLL
jgi:methanogenic corrinoid protein MtbC1